MKRLQAVVRTGQALHARPLNRFVQAVRRYQSAVTIRFGQKEAEAGNVLQMLLLAVPKGGEVSLAVEGPDQEQALPALVELLAELEANSSTAAEDAEPGASTPAEQAEPGASTKATGEAFGHCGAPGRARGVLTLHERPPADLEEQPGTEEDAPARIREALAQVTQATSSLADPQDPFSDIFAGQLTLMQEPSLQRDLVQLAAQGLSAATAVTKHFQTLGQQFDQLESDFAAQRFADLADIRERLLDALGQGPGHQGHGDQPLVLLTDEATPSWLTGLNTAQVAGVISRRGGRTSHAAIVAAGRGIPLLFIGHRELANIEPGDWIELDASNESVRKLPPGEQGALPKSNPDQATAIRPLQGIALRANLGAPGELQLARCFGAQGCGLLRTELLFAQHRSPPSVEEQASAYTRIAAAMAPEPVTVRLFDIDEDKPLHFLPQQSGRGITALLQQPGILQAQLEALGQAQQKADNPISVLIPMITSLDQLAEVDALCRGALPLSAMIETPEAVALAPELARACAGLSLGTNDLARYTLGQQRSESTLGLHPRVLKLIAQTIDAAGRAGVPCSLCGELAGSPLFAPLLMGLGVNALSMAPSALPEVAGALQRQNRGELESLAKRCLGVDDPEKLLQLITSTRAPH